MNFYKILHEPSGLFYKPSKHGSKANLSKRGKVYQRKRDVTSVYNSLILEGKYRHPASRKGMTPEEIKIAIRGHEKSGDLRSRYFENYVTKTSSPPDWRIVEYSLEDDQNEQRC